MGTSSINVHIKTGDLSLCYVLEDFGSFPHWSRAVSLESAVVLTFLTYCEKLFYCCFPSWFVSLWENLMVGHHKMLLFNNSKEPSFHTNRLGVSCKLPLIEPGKWQLLFTPMFVKCERGGVSFMLLLLLLFQHRVHSPAQVPSVMSPSQHHSSGSPL